MEHLTLFQQSFEQQVIKVHEAYCLPEKKMGVVGEGGEDVVTDLTDHNQLSSMACLPVAKIVSASPSQLTVRMPRLGDLFLGIKHQPMIAKVIYHLHNYQEEYVIDGSLSTPTSSDSLWVLTQYPIPLILIDDYDSLFLEVDIILSSDRSHDQGEKIIKAYYGYLHHSLHSSLVKQAIYHLPLVREGGQLKITCGLWTIQHPNLATLSDG